MGSATNGIQTYARTSITANWLYRSHSIGCSRTPLHARNELITPVGPRITFHARTRSRNDVRNGTMINRSRTYFRLRAQSAR